MDGERKINLGEGVPLNAAGAANIFLNTGKNTTKLNSSDGTVIHLKTEKPADLGVHINTTLSIASSKKIRLLFVLNFMFSILCMMLSCSVAFYYWNEMTFMKRQLDLLRDQFLMQGIGQDKAQTSPLVSFQRPLQVDDTRQPRMEVPERRDDNLVLNPKRYFVEDLEQDMLLIDSRKNPRKENLPVHDLALSSKDSLVVQFNGASREINLGTQSIVGPWVRDNEISTRNSETRIELNNNFVTIRESGLYLVYAQLVYLTQAPNCYFIWAAQPSQKPRLLSTCATGDDSSRRPMDRSQMSCSVQTVARLYKGDIVNIAQREHNRTLWLREGYSYFGFVKLSS